MLEKLLIIAFAGLVALAVPQPKPTPAPRPIAHNETSALPLRRENRLGAPMTAARFSFRCSYMNSVFYDVVDETGRYEIEFRHSTCAYERSIWNKARDYDADAAPLVGWLNSHSHRMPLRRRWRGTNGAAKKAPGPTLFSTATRATPSPPTIRCARRA